VINAKFFHRVANSNRRFNSIELLSVNGSISPDQPVIRNHLVQYYESLLLELFIWRPKLDGLAFDSIDAEEAFWLEHPFEDREFKRW
jgi:hypothetical protein